MADFLNKTTQTNTFHISIPVGHEIRAAYTRCPGKSLGNTFTTLALSVLHENGYVDKIRVFLTLYQDETLFKENVA